ncbi:MAG TPA: cytochrome P450 [Micromonosporaceae bacterium]|nr:cytochrome P450 [Micromonosporaceae bacterium]
MPDPIPRPPGPAWGPVDAYRRRRRDILGLLTEVAAAHPRLAHLRLLNKSVYFVNDPELVREVLVVRSRSVRKGRGFDRIDLFLGAGLLTIEGETHRRHRRVLQPAFHRDLVRGYGDLMVAATARLPWTDGGQVDVAQEMARLALSIVAEALFGADLATGEMGDALAALDGFVAGFGSDRSSRTLLSRLSGQARRQILRSRDRFDLVVTRLLAGQQGTTSDFLSRLLESGLSEAEVLGEARTFVMAGHETTANVLIWALWLLDRHPGVAARLHAEVDALPGAPTVDDFPRLSYTHAVAAEVLRLYPSGYVISRRALEELTVDGWRIPAGDRLITSPYVCHRDPRWWGGDAGEFRPERWLDAAGRFGDRNPGQPRAAYLPFGAGPRMCIGEAFGWLELVLVLATLTRQWHPVVAEDPRPRPAVTLRPDGPVLARLQRRTVSEPAVEPAGLS